MTEKSMIKRVAKALAVSAGSKMVRGGQNTATLEFGWKGDGGHLDEYVEAHWKQYIHAAQFAVEAMREPSLEMILKGGGLPSTLDASLPQVKSVKEIWQAMIDEALNEQP